MVRQQGDGWIPWAAIARIAMHTSPNYLMHSGCRLLAAAVIMVVLGSAAGLGQEVAAGEWRISESLTVMVIGDGVWVHTSWYELSEGARFPGNGLIVRDGDSLQLIDTAWGVPITHELLDWIDSTLELPVTRAIITHYHGDSMGGTPALAERGIPFFASELTRSLGTDEGVPLPETIGDLDVGDVVPIGNVEVFYPGPGHTADNVFVWIPHARVLFGTCATRSPQFPGRGNTADAELDEWPRSIRRVLEQYPDVTVVVPGHGDPGDASLLIHTIEVLESP
jgi:glyoxylase-like metal-dependent hydrolase (beta-lactamase superfamily II)